MTFFSALLLGFLASAHCASMCSGLQNALQPAHTLMPKQDFFKHTLALNMGRVVCYTALGGILAWANMTLVNLVNLGEYVHWLRVLSAGVIFFIGLRMMFNLNVLFMFESMGHWIWSVAKTIHRPNIRGSVLRSFVNGIAWGMLPCGLLYSVYFTAALSASPLFGAQIMLGFALGTLPSLLASGASLMLLKNKLNRKHVQVTGGLLYCLGALLMVSSPFLVGMSFADTHPYLIKLSFCMR